MAQRLREKNCTHIEMYVYTEINMFTGRTCISLLKENLGIRMFARRKTYFFYT